MSDYTLLQTEIRKLRKGVAVGNKETQATKEKGIWLSHLRIIEFEQSCDRLVDQAIRKHKSLPSLAQKDKGGFKRSLGQNLANRLNVYKSGVLLFFHDLEVTPNNNLAERDIRPLKLKQKMSGCFQTRKGSQDFAILRSIIETARKQRWGLLSALQTDTKELIQKLRCKGPLPDSLLTIPLNQ